MILIKTQWFRKVYKLKLIYILNFAFINFLFITKLYLSKSYKTYFLIIFTKYIKKPSSAGIIKKINSRKELLLIIINTICICIIHFRSNYLNFLILIRETSALYITYKAVVIITVIEDAGEEERVSEEVITLFVLLSLSFLKLI